MVRFRDNRYQRFSSEMEDMLDRMSVSYCPECGSPSQMPDPRAMLSSREGQSITMVCPECGEFSVVRDAEGWKVSGTDIPYIMNGETNALTRLHRFDPSDYAGEDEALLEHIILLCQSAIEYRSSGDEDSMEDLVRQAAGLVVEATNKGIRDSDSTYFAAIQLFITLVAEGYYDDATVTFYSSHLAAAVPLMEPITASGALGMCAESMMKISGQASQIVLDAYDGLKDGPPGFRDMEPSERCIFLEGMAMAADVLGKKEDLMSFIAKDMEEWKTIASDPDLTEDDIDGLFVFLLAISEDMVDDTFDGIIDMAMGVADACSSTVPYLGDSLTMLLYEYRFDNGLHPYDRTKDLEAVIAKYSEPKDDLEASFLMKSLAFLAAESEDIDEAIGYTERALDMAKARRMQDSGYRGLVMDIGMSYMSLAEGDRKLQHAAQMKLKKMGITKDMLKAWKKAVRDE
ncbi:MAG: hypothetical protein IK043_01300 [Candidatus Methanomethylophilaceae archaeon]|nr:hypothetical protein [Candidatus Methanomethylophilaceae archaeon]